LGQGLNALIPPKKNHDSSDLEDKINQKVNESISHFPQELKEQFPLPNLRENFQKTYKTIIKTSVTIVNEKVEVKKSEMRNLKSSRFSKVKIKFFK